MHFYYSAFAFKGQTFFLRNTGTKNGRGNEVHLEVNIRMNMTTYQKIVIKFINTTGSETECIGSIFIVISSFNN